MKWPIVLLSFLAFNAVASFKMTTFNIRNFGLKGTSTDHGELIKVLTAIESDLIAVQEIVNVQSFKSLLQKEFPQYQIVFSNCGGGGKQKIGFLYNDKKLDLIKLQEDTKISRADGLPSILGCGNLRPALIGTFKNKKLNKEFTAILVHLKAGSGHKNFQIRWKQYKYLTGLVSKLKNADDVVLFGDFNTTGFINKDEDYKKFEDLLFSMQKETASNQLDCTSYWEGEYSSNGFMQPAILDHILYHPNFLQMKLDKIEMNSHCQAVACQPVPLQRLGRTYSHVSDHCPVSLSFK